MGGALMIRIGSNQVKSNRSPIIATAMVIVALGQFAGLCVALYALLGRLF